ncbi:MAG: hypothetical protein ACTHOJ_07860 [Sphingomonas oligoaromativorans]
MAKQFDAVLPAQKLNVTKSTVGGLGGTIGLRIVIDDTILPGRADAMRLIDAAWQKIVEDTWPAA